MYRLTTKLINKQMTRKEFLSYLGLAVITLMGIPSLLKNFAEIKEVKRSRKRMPGSSFGSGAYGV
jgi:hypothetical protein